MERCPRRTTTRPRGSFITQSNGHSSGSTLPTTSLATTSRTVSSPIRRTYGTVEFDAEDSGGLVLIEDLASAVSAIEIVVHQGEGLSDEKWADPDHQELTHYYKFLRLVDGTSPIGDLHPAPLNPRTADFPAAVRPASDLFNAAYRYLYFTLDELFGPVAEKGPLVGRVYTLMSAVLGPLANYLMQQPTGNGGVCGPTFEVFEFSGEPRRGLGELAAMVRQEHPGLADIAGTVAGL